MLDERIRYLRILHAIPLMTYEDIALIATECQTNISANGALQSDQCQRTRYLGASIGGKKIRISHRSGELLA
jgi:hypothetical protein